MREVSAALGYHVPSNVSIFYGRIADTGLDPLPIMAEAVETPHILKELPLIGKPLEEYSLDTVKMFHGDATGAGFRL